MTADFSNLSPVSLDSNQFYGLIGITTEGTARLFAPTAFVGVTSVGLSVPTGLVVTGSPVTTSGTLALAYDTGYAIPTTAKQTLWDSALQPAAIGSTVLAFDSNLQSFVNAFTLPVADGTAGQVLATNGAGVIGFATVSGFDFIQDTAPTITTYGQTWLKPTDGSYPGTAGIWISRVVSTSPFVAYWMSSPMLTAEFTQTLTAASTSRTTVCLPGNESDSVYVESIEISVDFLTPFQDASNYWSMAFAISGVYTGSIASTLHNTQNLFDLVGSDSNNAVSIIPNGTRVVLGARRALYLDITKTLSPGTMKYAVALIFRKIHP